MFMINGESPMKTLNRSLLATAIAATLLGTASYTSAVETASALRGTVVDPQGTPVNGSTVTVINQKTGYRKVLTTDASGHFSLRGVPVGDDYTVIVSDPSFSSTRTDDLILSLGQTADLTFRLEGVELEEVVVVASAGVVTNVAPGPSASFDLETLKKAPAINRNIADVLRADPRVYIDESRSGVNAISCGGQNSRFNSITVDGARMNDSFGLNSNGYPTERMPFSFDAINQVSVEMAPFDVMYGGFTACNINAVTKSGGNEFRGSVFYDYTSDALRGDSLEGDDVVLSSFDEQRFGVTLGGPVIENTLSFFVAYEYLDGVNNFDRGPIGSGAINEVNITQSELDEIRQIAIDNYQYDPGSIPSAYDNEDEKLLLKLDWFINEAHRLSFTYNYNDGYNIVPSDGDLNELEFSNHLYERGAKLNSYVGTWFADWTGRFSTEVRLGYSDLDNRQSSLGGTDFGEMQIYTDDVTVYIGSDDSRQSNQLEYQTTSAAFKGFYDLDEHLLTFGLEYEGVDVYNLFVQHTETEIRFYGGIDAFRDGYAGAMYYNNAPSNNPSDAAADWAYAMNTAYIQDEWLVNDELELTLGLRYDRYTTGDKPPVNQDFLADYGFANDHTIDGLDLFQPRFAFNWDATDMMTVRGGIGLYSGGNPNVWLSNNYSANNVQQFGQRGRNFGYTDGSRSLFNSDVVYEAVEAGAPAGPGYGIPSELYDAVAAGEGDNFEINYLDPDFKLPSEWKFALGSTYFLPLEYTVNADVIVTKGQDTAIVLRGDLDQVGTNDEGYPVYESNREASFVLTNSDKGNESLVASVSLNKVHDFGLDWTLGYAYSDAKDVQPMTSSVAFSNYMNRAFTDPQEQKLSTSNYNIRHRFTATLNYEAFFWNDNATTISLYAAANEGTPYSYTLADDPNSVYGYTPYLEGNPILVPGEDRNEHGGAWWAKADLKVEQELGGVGAEDKLSVFMVVDNLTNLLNDEWGILRQANFPGNVPQGQAKNEYRVGDASLYQIRLGMNYEF